MKGIRNPIEPTYVGIIEEVEALKTEVYCREKLPKRAFGSRRIG